MKEPSENRRTRKSNRWQSSFLTYVYTWAVPARRRGLLLALAPPTAVPVIALIILWHPSFCQNVTKYTNFNFKFRKNARQCPRPHTTAPSPADHTSTPHSICHGTYTTLSLVQSSLWKISRYAQGCTRLMPIFPALSGRLYSVVRTVTSIHSFHYNNATVTASRSFRPIKQ